MRHHHHEPSDTAVTSSFTGALRKHLRWQRALLERLKNVRQRQNTSRFLVLRPGDKLTMGPRHERCSRTLLQCISSAKDAADRRTLGSVCDPRSLDLSRPIPGLGNVALSLISAAATAICVGVLLLENFSAVE